jgi:Tol biopolymer transport system component
MQSERDRRLIQIVEAALGRTAGERTSFLLEESGGDEELFAEASELLAQTGSNGGFLRSWAAIKVAEVLAACPTLNVGQTLGPYRIEGKVAAGGMGEVYRATDLRLKRPVALKVLFRASADGEGPARMLEEARALSRLNHPSICTIHDVGICDGVPYLVMELLEGHTLRDALNRQTPPLATAIEWAISIAEALHAAHHCGVIHRDLKPENIVITRNGPKLVDFGIAALTTKGRHATPAGTLPYMSPEQVRSEAAGPQSDMFSFGAVLFEMLTGRPAFEGADGEIIARSISSGAPPAIQLDPGLPRGLKGLIEACLAHSPDRRWQSAFDAATTLRWIHHGVFESITARRGRLGLAASLAIVALAACAAVIWISHPARGPREPVRFTFDAEPGTELVKPAELSLAPGGKAIAFTARDAQTTRIYVRRFDDVYARPAGGTERGRHPFWSADGSSLAFFADGKLKRVPAGGGPSVIVCDAPRGTAGAWGSRGNILFSTAGGPVYQVEASGGRPRTVTQLDLRQEEDDHRWPAFLPDGTHFLYTAHSNRHEGKLFVHSPGGATPVSVLDTQGEALYSQGRIYYPRGSSLIAQDFDLSSFQTRGDTIALAAGVSAGSFSVSQDGVIAFWGGIRAEPAPLAWVDRTGQAMGSLGPPLLYTGIVLSPAGNSVVATVCDSVDCEDPTVANNVRRYNLRLLRDGLPPVQLTNDEAVAAGPVWSPKGDELIYGSTKAGHMDLYRRKIPDGNEAPLLSGGVDRGSTSWSRDGRYVAFTERTQQWKFDIWTLDLVTGKPALFLRTDANETMAAFSPDGKWIAYSSDESGVWNVYVLPFPASARGETEPIRVSSNEGLLPLWRSDGSEIFYQAGREVVAAAVGPRMGGGLTIGPRKTLFSLRRQAVMGNSFAVDPNGTRFLILDGAPAAGGLITVQIP